MCCLTWLKQSATSRHFSTISTDFQERKGNGKEVEVVQRLSSVSRPLSAQMWITQSYLQITTSAFPSYKHSLEGDTTANSFTHLATDILLIPRPTEGRRRSWPGWLIHSGRLTHEVVTRQP